MAIHRMTRTQIAQRVLFVSSAVLCMAGATAAQTAVYVTGGAFADSKRFGSANGGYYPIDAGDTMPLDGTGAGGSARVGTFLLPRLSLELSIDVGARTHGDLMNPYRILAIAQPAQPLQVHASTKFVTVSTVVGFHPTAHGRLHLGYLGGLSFVRGTYTSEYPSYGAPIPLFTGAIPPDAGTALVVFPPPTFTIRTLTQKDNKLGLVLGFEAAVDVAKHFAIVPEIRALTFSVPFAGPPVFLLRPGVGVRWNF